MSKDLESMGEYEFRMPTRRRLELGQVIEGTVVSIGESHVFVDVGTKSEATLDAQEVRDDKGQMTIKIGDTISAYVVTIEPDVVLSYAMARAHLNLKVLEDAHDLGIPVEGKVAAVNKGGFEIDLNGSRAFCPISQIELGYCEDAAAYVGKSLQFRVVEFSDGRNIVVSRRAVLEEERQESMAETQAQLVEGAQFEGEVVSLQPYGAFVDIGGMQGMVHISEIAHGHIAHPEEVLKVGQKVRVKVLRVERDPKHPDRMRVGLSIRALLGDPWDDALGKLSEGMVVEGKIVRLQPFGAFVEIAPGIDGLVHISELSDRRIQHPSDVVAVGQAVKATVLKVDAAAKRISLTLRGQDVITDGAITAGAVVDVLIDKIKPFGLLVKIKGGGRNARGLIPIEETGAGGKGGQQANLRRSFTEGAELKAMITAVEPDTGKIRLSLRAVAEHEEQGDYAKFLGPEEGVKASGGEAKPAGMGKLGDLLMKSLKKNK
jgi:small subunit ribosomal protein S1